jgi:hypothetical protein
MLFFRKNQRCRKYGTRNSNAYQNEMTQSKSKEISAQKLCAGTVSECRHQRREGFIRHQNDALRLAMLLKILAGLTYQC